MFGKGVYFADIASKSVGYCRTHASNGIGLMLLCKVALGETNDLLQSNYNASKLPKGKSSTKGVGRSYPDPKKDIVFEEKSKLAVGPIIQDSKPGGLLYYNEFIVYDVNQVEMRYLFKLKAK
jgi:poly [ADP-ribose] polymerase 2/3/4